MNKRSHLVNWLMVCLEKSEKGWALNTLLSLIRCFCVSGVADTQLKEDHFGNRSLAANIGNK